ncbi:DGAT1 [Auxenochlorella protothecoides x Auxenochlorella symbiontica]
MSKERVSPWGRLTGSGSKRSSSPPNPLEATIESLKQENQRLKELISERTSQGATQSGYLNKYRPHATASLWAHTWEPRYVVVRTGHLSYYRNEEGVQFHPRGQLDLEGTSVVAEGLKRRAFHTFQIVDSAGATLLRLSSDSPSEARAWMDALERAGCRRRSGGEEGELARRDSSSTVNTAGGEDSEAESSGGAGAAAVSGKHIGYTSDTSDVQSRPPRRPPSGNGGGGGGHSGHHQGSAREGSGEGQPKRKREAMKPSAPLHTATKYSIMSSERVLSSNQNGMVNLTLLVLAAANFRLILENLLKYGLRFNPVTFARRALTPQNNPLLFLCWPTLLALCLAALGIERLALAALRREQARDAAAAKKGEGRNAGGGKGAVGAGAAEWLILALNVANTSAMLAVPSAVIHYTDSEVLPGFALTAVAIVLWMKAVSYAHCNWDLRCARRAHELRDGERGSGLLPAHGDPPLRYPENLTLGNLAYFLAVPTLCYQLTYPRSTRFRIRWLLRRVATMLVTLTTMLFIIEQYIEPTIHNSIQPMMTMDWPRMVERLLKLSLPNLYLWLLMFYTLFDLWLNIVAELTGFGDREFYKEWWNATTVGEYWRLWNMPVHSWMLRHVYFPCVRHKIPKFTAGLIVFFVSAVFHEILVALPLHMVKGWAFYGLMAQVPLMLITEKLKQRFESDRIGNAIFWMSFCILGQPLSIMLYYHDWRKEHGA